MKNNCRMPKSIALIVIIIMLVAFFVFLHSFEKTEFKITKEVCEEERILVEKNLDEWKKDYVNETIRIDEVEYIGDMEERIFFRHDFDYLNYSLRRAYLVGFVNATYYDYESGETKPYHYLIDWDTEVPLELLEDWRWYDGLYKIIDSNYTSLNYKEATFTFELLFEAIERTYENQTICEQVESSEEELYCNYWMEKEDCEISGELHLNLKWLDNHCECVDWKYSSKDPCLKSNETEEDCDYTRTCSKYKCGDYFVEIK